jgi:hypothetical protein
MEMSTLADVVITALQPPQLVKVQNRLNVRSAPSISAPRVDRLEPGRSLAVDGVVQGDAFLGKATWFRVANLDQFFWSGGAQLMDEPASAASAINETASAAPSRVHRRSNGTILPLTNAQIGGVFGSFTTRDAKQRGAVVITSPDWESQNLVPLDHHVLGAVMRNPTPVHRIALRHFMAVFDSIEQAGLAHLILTCDGTFVPRYKNWNPVTGELSSHSWGIAIDINARWNSVGCEPALPGETGCLRQLVPMFAANGFAWGGHFSRGMDGMHFELAREDV